MLSKSRSIDDVVGSPKKLVGIGVIVDPNIDTGEPRIQIGSSADFYLDLSRLARNIDLSILANLPTKQDLSVCLGLGVANRWIDVSEVIGTNGEVLPTLWGPVIRIGFYKDIDRVIEPFAELKFYLLENSSITGLAGFRWKIKIR